MAKEKTATERYVEEVNGVRGVFMSTLSSELICESMLHLKEGMSESDRDFAKRLDESLQRINQAMRKHFPPLIIGEDY